MGKVRVDKLAQELGLAAEELFTQLKGMGLNVVNTTSAVDREQVDMVKDMLVGAPKKRATPGRRIVSVHKGAKRKPEVEVRVEEEQPPVTEAPPAAAEGMVGEPAAPEEPPGKAAKEKAVRGKAVKAKEGETAETPVPEAVPPESAAAAEGQAPPATAPMAAGDSAAASPAGGGADEVRAGTKEPERKERGKGKEERPLLTAMELERGIRAPTGREIPIQPTTLLKPRPAAPAAKTAAPRAGAAPEQPEKVVKEKPKRVAPRKEKKVTKADLLREVEELTTPLEEAVPAEPKLKVVEIRHAPVPPTAGRRRPEPPKKKLRKPGKKARVEAVKEEVKGPKKAIRITPGITVADIARLTGTKAPAVIKMLFDLGLMVTINQTVEPETAALIAGELGFETEVRKGTLEEIIGEEPEMEGQAVPRPPVVTVMGHVDHGKTSLLDAIRKSDVVAGEAGGITQHIGAYMVNHPKGQLVFLDTPGHEAFTAMRARGARVTDLVVLVVAADDGVMPQTVEAIDHAKAAGVPILVAVNKIDKPEANPERVKQALAEKGLVPEEWGGDTLYAYVSAKKKLGIDELLDRILLQAEMMALKADPNREARGTVIEAHLDKGRGPVATVLVAKGTLRVGDLMVAGAQMSRVRAMLDDKGKKLKEAPPATPVEVVGLSDVPAAGESFLVFRDEGKARRVMAKHAEAGVVKAEVREKITLEGLFSRIKEGEIKELRIVLKADVQGSVEALREALVKIGTDAVRVKIIHSATGAINESDITLAMASDAIVIGFNVRPDSNALELARKERVDVRFYNVIYNAVDEVRDALRGLLAPILREQFLGRAEVRQTFNVPKVGTIAGSYVHDGTVRRNARVRVLRDGVVVNEGRISSLKRFKDDAREVTSGYECGIGVENFNDVKVGDILEAYEIVEEKAEL